MKDIRVNYRLLKLLEKLWPHRRFGRDLETVSDNLSDEQFEEMLNELDEMLTQPDPELKKLPELVNFLVHQKSQDEHLLKEALEILKLVVRKDHPRQQTLKLIESRLSPSHVSNRILKDRAL